MTPCYCWRCETTTEHRTEGEGAHRSLTCTVCGHNHERWKCPLCDVAIPRPYYTHNETCPKCGLVWACCDDTFHATNESLKALLARVEAETREKCAKLCDDLYVNDEPGGWECAEAIRSMGD